MCEVPDCERVHHAAGYCITHNQRRLRTGSADPDRPVRVALTPEERTCGVEGCERPTRHRVNGTVACPVHNYRWNKHGDFFADVPIVTWGIEMREALRGVVRFCKVPGCERQHYASGWCNCHYIRSRKYGDPVAEVPIGRRRFALVDALAARPGGRAGS